MQQRPVGDDGFAGEKEFGVATAMSMSSRGQRPSLLRRRWPDTDQDFTGREAAFPPYTACG
ncbi:hypothetical protein SAMN06272735_0187 [Streptomyces sp. TLI_55]|nr:hypothetical protein SAMN06272735_0187 [Streptomyces sp. TLI_55]